MEVEATLTLPFLYLPCVCCTTVVVNMGLFKLNRTHQYYLSYCKLDLVQLVIMFVDINLVLTVESKILQQILF